MKRKIALIGVVAGLVSGCAHLQGSKEAQAAQQLAEAENLKAAAAQLDQESERILQAQDDLAREMERRTPAPAATAPEAAYAQIPLKGPLTSKTFGMSMQDARIGQLMWILAMEFNMGLSIDPAVLESPRTVNLYLKDVTGRQALIHILEAFDVHGSVGSDNVMRINPMEERIFPVDALVVKGLLNLNVGGDAMGGSSSDSGSSGLRDSVVLTGTLGDEKSDVWSALRTTLDTLLAEGEAGKTDAKADNKADAARYVMDSSSGSLYLRARPSKIRSVAQMLEKGRNFRARQVQIDAQLLDISLSDDSQLGINWTALGNRVIANLGASPINIGQVVGSVGRVPSLTGRSLTIPSQMMGLSGTTSGSVTLSNRVFSATINALKDYGKVKLLSNPSIRLKNGVPAYLSIGTNYRYIKEIKSVVATSANTTGTTPVTMEVKTDTVFSGVVLGLGAVVKEGGEIELFVRPSQTEVERASLGLVDIGNSNRLTLPVVNTKSITTMLNMRDGDVVLLGGLIDQQASHGRNGVPGLSEVPGLGALFGTSSEQSLSRELVMVIRARIVP